MKRKKFFCVKLIAILCLLLIFLTGCGKVETTNNESNEENKGTEVNQETNENVQTKSVSSKGGSFVKYEGYTYYWKLTANSRSKTALFANYTETLNTKNDLVKMDENGNKETVLTDKGSGEIFISDNKMFLSYAEDEYNSKRKIYSVNMKGENKVEYQDGIMRYIVGDYIICQTQNDGDIFRINTKTDEIQTLKENANILGCVDGIIYYAEANTYSTGILKIGFLKGTEDSRIVATFSKSEFENYAESAPIEVTEFWSENDKIKMYIGYRAGTANMLQEQYLLTMDKDGKNLKKETSNYDEAISEEEQKTEGVYFKTIQQNGEYISNLMYVDEETKERKEFMTESEINEKFGFTSDDEHTTSLYTSNIDGKDIFVVLDYGEHYSEEDIGWRYSYKRLKTVAFKYNIDTNEVTEIYSF